MIRRCIFILVLLSGCSSFDATKPRSLNMTPPKGSPEFQQGWTDGCNSALAAINTDANLLLATHKYKIDGDLWRHNKAYKIAWNESHMYCALHLVTWAQHSW